MELNCELSSTLKLAKRCILSYLPFLVFVPRYFPLSCLLNHSPIPFPHSHSIRFQCDFHRQFYTLLTLFNFSQSHSTVTQFSNIFFTSYSHPKQRKQKIYSWLIEKNWWFTAFACATVSVLVLKNFNKFSHANRPKVNLQLDKVQ